MARIAGSDHRHHRPPRPHTDDPTLRAKGWGGFIGGQCTACLSLACGEWVMSSGWRGGTYFCRGDMRCACILYGDLSIHSSTNEPINRSIGLISLVLVLVLVLVWFGLVWFGLVWCVLVWFGVVWFGSVGVVWFGLVWFGLVWFGLVWFSLVWFGVAWCGLVWFGVV